MLANDILGLIKHQSKHLTPIKSVNHNIPTYGLSYPQMSKIAKQIQNPIQFLDSNTSEVYELYIIHTMVLKRVKDIDLAIHYFKVYCNIAKEWSVVDSLCQRFVIAKVYPKQVFDVLVELSSSSDEFVQRCVAVMCLSHFLNDEYINEVSSLLLQLKCEGYYTQMAIAWAIATIMVQYPEHAISLLMSQNLFDWTQRKAIQKIQESYRVSPSLKQQAKKLKRESK